jgi:hypothetical protein
MPKRESCGSILLPPRPPSRSPPTYDPHSTRCTAGCHTSRDFVPWRFSDAHKAATLVSRWFWVCRASPVLCRFSDAGMRRLSPLRSRALRICVTQVIIFVKPLGDCKTDCPLWIGKLPRAFRGRESLENRHAILLRKTTLHCAD